jgi:phospholipid/cholesterol/gamma-HCH transport system substrate-binding protein
VRTPSNHWKLGLFVVVGLGLFMATLVFLGARSLDKETVTYKTYFDESVQGLDVGSPVKFRGVTVGDVSSIDIAPDRRHVEVSCELTVSQIVSLGLVETAKVKHVGFARKEPVTLSVPPDLRMQLGSSGLTGVKFVQLDFFTIKDNPPPMLSFPVPDRYVPAAASTMKNLEDAVVKALDRFPEIAEELLRVMVHANRILDSIDQEKLPERATVTLASADELIASLKLALQQANVGSLSNGAQKTIDQLSVAVTHLAALLAKVDGQEGLVASATRATDSIGDLAGGAKGLGAELGDTMRDIREAVDSIQRLADALDTDSDMLLKGRAKGRP